MSGSNSTKLTAAFDEAYNKLNPKQTNESNGIFPEGFPPEVMGIMSETYMKTVLKKLTPLAPEGGYNIRNLPPGVKKEQVKWMPRVVGPEKYFVRIMYDCTIMNCTTIFRGNYYSQFKGFINSLTS